MSAVTLVLATRNDTYACELGIDNESIKKTLLTATSFRKHYRYCPIVVVDWGTAEDRQPVRSFFDGFVNVRIVTVPYAVTKEIQGHRKINFHEYVAKHLAIQYVCTTHVLVGNNDLIYTACENVLPDMLQAVISNRTEIPYSSVALPLDTLVNEHRQLVRGQTHPGAQGDFLLIRKDEYLRVGGYLLAHQNWAVDSEFTERLRSNSFCITRSKNELLHLSHRELNQHRGQVNPVTTSTVEMLTPREWDKVVASSTVIDL